MSGQIDVPVLPVALPLGLLMMVVSAVALRRRGVLTGPRLAGVWLSGWYWVAVFTATMLPLHLAWGAAADEPDTFRILLNPFFPVRPDDFILNAIMTIPIALALLVTAGVTTRRRVVLFGLALSATIEAVQLTLLFTLDGNRWFDVNDLLANTLGALLGWLLLRRALRHDRFRALVERVSLPPAPLRSAGSRASAYPG